jgi:glycosyltransferase involved in cell wall biosynthesis
MGDLVASLLRSPEQATQFGIAGRRRAQEFFSIDAMVTRYLRLLNEDKPSIG